VRAIRLERLLIRDPRVPYGARSFGEYRINSDTIVIGVEVPGMWLETARAPNLVTAWRLLRLAWNALWYLRP
jgi:hypothetical protein